MILRKKSNLQQLEWTQTYELVSNGGRFWMYARMSKTNMHMGRLVGKDPERIQWQFSYEVFGHSLDFQTISITKEVVYD